MGSRAACAGAAPARCATTCQWHRPTEVRVPPAHGLATVPARGLRDPAAVGDRSVEWVAGGVIQARPRMHWVFHRWCGCARNKDVDKPCQPLCGKGFECAAKKSPLCVVVCRSWCAGRGCGANRYNCVDTPAGLLCARCLQAVGADLRRAGGAQPPFLSTAGVDAGVTKMWKGRVALVAQAFRGSGEKFTAVRRPSKGRCFPHPVWMHMGQACG